ncbi:hypothetical protein FBD94_15400 [Pedobacter hiemivivus]|uniref:Uncharacterized protein n=1 Tax=Pedobacter hiemivivus TaxID=2530454 RepID=A0A4U1GBL4_9SPHI|nr:hypothetical protein [Pedobacter hiemivivus]TKC60289.1 hypothetical protein FBD94_15400 [Pedobacter hiemivivus]
MKKLQIYFLFLLLTGIAFNSYGQQGGEKKESVDVQRQKQQRNYYRKTLQLDSLKAQQVAEIQDSYKAALKLVVSDTGLNIVAKRARISTLIDSKNLKLQKVLSPEQLDKVIPTTERENLKKVSKP